MSVSAEFNEEQVVGLIHVMGEKFAHISSPSTYHPALQVLQWRENEQLRREMLREVIVTTPQAVKNFHGYDVDVHFNRFQDFLAERMELSPANAKKLKSFVIACVLVILDYYAVTSVQRLKHTDEELTVNQYANVDVFKQLSQSEWIRMMNYRNYLVLAMQLVRPSSHKLVLMDSAGMLCGISKCYQGGKVGSLVKRCHVIFENLSNNPYIINPNNKSKLLLPSSFPSGWPPQAVHVAEEIEVEHDTFALLTEAPGPLGPGHPHPNQGPSSHFHSHPAHSSSSSAPGGPSGPPVALTSPPPRPPQALTMRRGRVTSAEDVLNLYEAWKEAAGNPADGAVMMLTMYPDVPAIFTSAAEYMGRGKHARRISAEHSAETSDSEIEAILRDSGVNMSYLPMGGKGKEGGSSGRGRKRKTSSDGERESRKKAAIEGVGGLGDGEEGGELLGLAVDYGGAMGGMGRDMDRGHGMGLGGVQNSDM